MLRKLLGACLALGLSGASAMAIPVFDGTFVFQTAANNCDAGGKSFQAIYRPQIVTSGIPSGLVLFQYREGAGFIRGNNGQFNGAGPFAGVQVTANATLVQRTGVFQITQTPPTIVDATQAVTLNGSFTPSAGCRYVFKATFLRRPGT